MTVPVRLALLLAFVALVIGARAGWDLRGAVEEDRTWATRWLRLLWNRVVQRLERAGHGARGDPATSRRLAMKQPRAFLLQRGRAVADPVGFTLTDQHGSALRLIEFGDTLRVRGRAELTIGDAVQLRAQLDRFITNQTGYADHRGRAVHITAEGLAHLAGDGGGNR